MRPMRRKRAAFGRTFAKAFRTSSIRLIVAPMPSAKLPAIEPDASKTIMASSTHGLFVSSAPVAVVAPGNKHQCNNRFARIVS